MKSIPVKSTHGSMLLIIWGYVMAISYAKHYIMARLSAIYVPWELKNYIDYFLILIVLACLAYTIYYAYSHWSVRTKQLFIIWASVIGSWMLINLIQFKVLGELNLQLQHPLFMVVSAFGVVMTGVFTKYWLMIYGGIVFGLLAYASSFMILQDQLLFEAIAWLVSFQFPGHYYFSKRERN